MLMPQSMHICMRPYEDLQSYEKHLKNSTLSTQSQQLCSKRNNRGIYPHRETLGLQRPKKTKRIHGTVDSQNSLSSSLLNDSFLRRVGIPPGQAEGGHRVQVNGVHFTLALCKALCQVFRVHREPSIGPRTNLLSYLGVITTYI